MLMHSQMLKSFRRFRPANDNAAGPANDDGPGRTPPAGSFLTGARLAGAAA